MTTKDKAQCEHQEIRLIAESIISCINGKKYDNAKILAESIIAYCTEGVQSWEIEPTSS